MSGAPTDRMLELLDELFDGRLGSAEAEDTTLAALPEPLRVLWYLNWLDFEVSQGSLNAYFMNSHSRHADAWSARSAELDLEGEFSVVHPYRGLAGADELEELTSRFHDTSARERWARSSIGTSPPRSTPSIDGDRGTCDLPRSRASARAQIRGSASAVSRLAAMWRARRQARVRRTAFPPSRSLTDMERHRLALLTALAVLAVPAAAQAAPVKISPQPTSVAGSTATVEVANPNRYALSGSATVVAGARTAATRAVKLPKRSVTDVKLRFDAKGLDALRAANGRATVKLALRRAGGKKTKASRTLTLRFATGGGPAPAPGGSNGAPAPSGGSSTPAPGGSGTAQPALSNKWVGRLGTEGAYDDLEFTLVGGQLQITKTPLVPVYCFENGAGHYGNALSYEPFVVAGPWTVGTDGSVQQSGIATNRLVSSGSRGITYTLKESAQTAGTVTGKLGMSFFDSKYDIFVNQVWFVNCSGSQSFEAVPAP